MKQYKGLQYNDTATTLGGILQDIYFLGKCNVNTFPTGDYYRIINKYYGQLQEVIRSVNENFYMVSAVTNLVISTDGVYNYPDGVLGTGPAYEKIKSIWAAYEPVSITSPVYSDYRRVDIIDPDSISDPAYTFSAEEPKALIFGNYFKLFPLVTDVTRYPVANGVKMYYIATQDELVNDNDVPKIFPSFHDAITQGALIDIHKRLGDDDASEKCKKLFEKRLEEIKSYASAHIPDELGVIEGQDTLGGWAFPWGFNSMS